MKKKIDVHRFIVKNIRHKITVKLTALIACIMIFLLFLAMFIQFVVVSRNYMTSDYTKARLGQLQKAVIEMESNGLNTVNIEQNQDKCKVLFNRYEKENTASVMLFDSYGNLVLRSEDTAGWLSSSIPYYTKLFCNGKIYRYNNDEMIRLRGFAGIGTRLVGFYHVILPTDTNAENAQAYFLVVVTREVYTSGTRNVFVLSSLFLFLITTFLCIFISFFLARKITKPVLEIRDVAGRMAQLDFSEKCNISGEDEISTLAMSINFLSDKLEETIVQLADANGRLQKDLNLQLETDRMRKNFIAAASHEFKTPLTLLRGYMEMLQDNCLSDEDAAKAKATILAEIDRMDKMVLRLLELSRITADEFQMQIASFNLVEVICCSVGEMALVIRQRQLHFTQIGTNEPCMVLGNMDYIEEVITNLLSNAVKHTPINGGIRLTLEKESESVKLSVYNDGIQIAEKELENIWEPFYMVDKSRSKKSGGTGLGLSICREILTKHNSNFGIRNLENGVEAYFTLQKLDSACAEGTGKENDD